MTRILRPRATFDTMSDALAAYPTMQAGEIGVIMFEGAPVHSWVMTGTGTSVTHPGRGWFIPTELLETGTNGFTVDAGSITSGGSLGDQIVYDVDSGNAPTLAWMFPEAVDGKIRQPAGLYMRGSITLSGTPADAMELLNTKFIQETTGVYWGGGGVVRSGGVWYSTYNIGAAYAAATVSFLEARLTAIDFTAVVIAPRTGLSNAANTISAWCGPDDSPAGDLTHASAVAANVSNFTLAQTNEWMCYLENSHPGSGGDATVTISHIQVNNHVKLGLAV